ncbi:MAG: sigma-54 dependent transcriptional regulator [Gemmatimonadetes bacterium]|nr:sigma-54 dependent transcriptional regulator [Gemmatimonadota bacterium]MBT8403613.1 sigma-54 dependent transcriptional regulator [Gemmatimonadota bacterium]NNF37454.1 sigma-54-dependent Fis family transcriptional regulator [Gemmatimonadota bacterium]NNK62883.1 sigma-54-dependent Fis family transcriptional regulator [Gemmatimonadota bacterium]
MARILCVDDEAGALEVLKETLRKAGHEPVGVRNVDAALAVLGRGGVDLILSDYRMPGTSGLEFLQQIQESGLDVPLVMITGHASVNHAVTAMKAGAIDYLTKPIRAGQLELVVQQALELVRLRRQNQALRSEVSELRAGHELVGESRPFEKLMDTIRAAAPTRASVLLQGESGTGKEVLARTIHELSGRDDGAFITVNCAAMPEHLVESILFGHEKGAFTGAVKQVKGAFERANRGTLLLDEISEMRLDLQAKLLRALQENEFERVGGTSPVRVDVRVIATTNRDLPREVDEGRFRQDLYYRLNVLPMRVPALRERGDDIARLAQYFARKVARDLDRPTPAFTPEGLERLQTYPWPGNVRELAHAVERAVILAQSPELGPEAFDLLGDAPSGRGLGVPEGAVVLESLKLEDAEAALIEAALERTEGNRTRAAALLGMSVRTLRSKLNRGA